MFSAKTRVRQVKQERRYKSRKAKGGTRLPTFGSILRHARVRKTMKLFYLLRSRSHFNSIIYKIGVNFKMQKFGY